MTTKPKPLKNVQTNQSTNGIYLLFIIIYYYYYYFLLQLQYSMQQTGYKNEDVKRNFACYQFRISYDGPHLLMIVMKMPHPNLNKKAN